MLRYPLILIFAASFLVLNGCGGGTGIAPVTGQAPSNGGDPTNGGAPSNAHTLSNLQRDPSWTGYGELPSNYSICQSCVSTGPQVTWGTELNVSSPAMSGNSTKFSIGGTTPYADVLWVDHLIGAYSSQNLPDTNRTLVPSLHNFTYDVYFYSGNPQDSEALEFDINQYFDGKGYIWGHQCRVAAGNEWDTWDNVNSKWISTGVPCNPIANSWNHVTIQVQRTSDGNLLFQSITFNGVTSALNITRPPGTAPSNWYGVTVNYQMDGNFAQQAYSVWLDKFNFTYW